MANYRFKAAEIEAMKKNILFLVRTACFLALLLALFSIPCLATAALAADGDVSPSQSVVTTGANNTVVDPYQSFNYIITLKNAQGNALSANPTGKVYVWATDGDDLVASGLDLVGISVPQGVYIHETARQGVFVMDARALIKSQKMKLDHNLLQISHSKNRFLMI